MCSIDTNKTYSRKSVFVIEQIKKLNFLLSVLTPKLLMTPKLLYELKIWLILHEHLSILHYFYYPNLTVKQQKTT